jgi:hypothetical protein
LNGFVKIIAVKPLKGAWWVEEAYQLKQQFSELLDYKFPPQ